MDQYAEAVRAAVRRRAPEGLVVHEARPPVTPLSRTLRSLLGMRRPFAYWRRFPSYMQYARGTRFAVNHVLDHAYGHLAYALPPERTVVTCHDIFRVKLWRGGITGMPRRKTPPLTVQASLSGLRRAAVVITPTDATRRDLERYVGLDPDKVVVVPYGLNNAFTPLCAAAKAAARVAIPAPAGVRILAVDSGGAYKNQRALAAVLARLTAEGRDVTLVHVGRPEALLAEARRFSVDQRVVALGARTQEELVEVYAGCDVLLFPSYYEGFGWPPLEAMACGVPVVASTAAAVLEVVGDAALVAGPDDHDGLAERVGAVLDHRDSAAELILRGFERAAAYTWNSAGERLIDIYEARLEVVA